MSDDEIDNEIIGTITEDKIKNITTEGEQIAIRLFRFKARRGIGVFYLFFAFFIITSFIIQIMTNSILYVFIFWIPGSFLLWYIPRISGFRGFGRVNYAIALVDIDRKLPKQHRFIWNILSIIRAFWPWILFVFFLIIGKGGIAVIFPTLWIAQIIIIRYLKFKSNEKVIVEQRIEDWVVIFALALASILVIIPHIGLLGFVYITPVLILAGTKSLFDSPEEIIYESGA